MEREIYEVLFVVGHLSEDLTFLLEVLLQEVFLSLS